MLYLIHLAGNFLELRLPIRSMHTLWLLIVDMNQCLTEDDKISGRKLHPRNETSLWNILDACELLDLGLIGLKFTWSNK